MGSIEAAAAFGVVPASVVGVIATAVLAWAWHGRKVEPRPTCRRCGFGLNPRGGVTPSTCHDCGEDLSRPHAVHVVQRRKRRATIAAAVATILLSTAWVTLASLAQARRARVIHHAPTAWLIDSASGADERARDAALAELARRVTDGELSPARERALVEQALALQADWRRPWARGWGDVIESARAAGRLSDAQWARYQVQSLSLVLEPAKPTLGRNDRLVLNLFRGPDRVSSKGSSFDLTLELEPAVTVAGKPVPCHFSASEYLFPVPAPSGAAAGTKIAAGEAIELQRDPSLRNLPAGPQSAQVAVTVRPVRVVSDGSGDGLHDLVPLPGVRRVEVAGRFQVRNDEPPLDELVGPEWTGVWVPPEKREALMRAAAKRKPVQVRTN